MLFEAGFEYARKIYQNPGGNYLIIVGKHLNIVGNYLNVVENYLNIVGNYLNIVENYLNIVGKISSRSSSRPR